MADDLDTSTGEETPAEEMVPKSVMLGRLKQESQKRSALEKQLAELNGRVSEFSTLQERLQQMEEERTLAGKSAEEKAAAAYQRELDKIRREAEGLKGTIAEREKAIAATQDTLRNERAMRQIGDVLAAEKAVNASRAARYAMADITIEHNEEGAMVATYGDREGISVSEAVKAWLKDNDNFLPSPGGGAGTQRPSGSGGRPLHELSASELQKMARRRR